MNNYNELLANAKSVLRQNDTGIFTKPGPRQYPHQWNWDSAFIALGLSHFDLPRALVEIHALFTGQWRDGMLPHVVYHNQPSDYFPNPEFWQIENSPDAPKVATSGITQPPVLATIIRRIHSRTPIPVFLRQVYPDLLRWHRWLHTARDADGSGLVYIIHPWESGTDDSPRWLEVMSRITPHDQPAFQRRDTKHVAAEERPFREDYERFIYLIDIFRRNRYEPSRLLEQSPFLVQDVLFNSVLFRADEDLRALAVELGESTTEVDIWIERMRSNFNGRFWDGQRGLYLDYDLRAGRHIRVNTAMTFLPLFAGIASREKAARLIEIYWLDPDEYAPGTRLHYAITSVSQKEPTWESRRYWRGPIWVNLNWLLALGLQRYGYNELAQQLEQDSLELMHRSGFREYYDPLDGRGCGSLDFSWSAALAIEMNTSEGLSLR